MSSNPTKKRKSSTTPAVVDEFKFSLKAMINKERTKVMFVEANSDFADVLLCVLTLPLGKIVKILKNHYGKNKDAPIVGSLTTLQKGLANLNHVYFEKKGGKQMLLNPISPCEKECYKLRLNVYDAQPLPTKYFACGDSECKKKGTPCLALYDSDSHICPHCLKPLTTEIRSDQVSTDANYDGVFIRRTTSLLITDDLQMMPNELSSFIKILENVGITDITGLELRTVTIGFKEIMDLIKGSLLSRTPLTDFILNNHSNSATAKSAPGILLHQMEKNTSSHSMNKMIVKAMTQKSTNKILFIQADTKEDLLNPLLAPMYGTVNQIFPLSGKIDRTQYYYPKNETRTEFVSQTSVMYNYTHQLQLEYGSLVTLMDTKGGSSYVKRPGVFLITDDLTVLPLSMTNGFSIINRLKILPSDVGEVEINIGLEEALSILKASLNSTSALSDGLNTFLVKRPKQEH